jgi:hypothetical protein
MLSQRQADQLAVQFKEKLQTIATDALAVQSGFVKRKPRKIKPVEFLLGFFKMVLTDGNSLWALAIAIGLSCHCRISKQAVHKRIKAPLLKFLELVLAAALAQVIKPPQQPLYPNIFKLFKRVLIQDSTTLRLDPKLAKFFPGSRNGTSQPTAIVRIQAVFNLLQEEFCEFKLSAFTDNDQKNSALILNLIQAGDLILRDLGYLVLAVIKKIHGRGAYYLSRLKCGLVLYDRDGKTPLNLLELLNQSGRLDREVYVGKKEKIRARVVAIRLPEEVAAERRRKAKTNRDRRCKPSKEHLALLGWEIFITNVDRHMLTAQKIADLYELRWRIEMVFKSWKSHFKMTHVPKGAPTRVKSHLYAMLIFITIFQVHVYVRLYRENQRHTQRQLSLFKLTKFFKEQIWAVVIFFQNSPRLTQDELEEQIFYHCLYDSRKDRQNHIQKTQALG